MDSTRKEGLRTTQGHRRSRSWSPLQQPYQDNHSSERAIGSITTATKEEHGSASGGARELPPEKVIGIEESYREKVQSANNDRSSNPSEDSQVRYVESQKQLMASQAEQIKALKKLEESKNEIIHINDEQLELQRQTIIYQDRIINSFDRVLEENNRTIQSLNRALEEKSKLVTKLTISNRELLNCINSKEKRINEELAIRDDAMTRLIQEQMRRRKVRRRIKLGGDYRRVAQVLKKSNRYIY